MLSVLPTAARAKRCGRSNDEMRPPPPPRAWRRVTLNIIHPPWRLAQAGVVALGQTAVDRRYFKPKTRPGQADALAHFRALVPLSVGQYSRPHPRPSAR